MEKKKEKVIKEIQLSDGRMAYIHEGKGKDLFWAQRYATDPNDILKLLLIRLVSIEGQSINEEILDELPLQDAMLLLRTFTEVYSPLLVERPSSA